MSGVFTHRNQDISKDDTTPIVVMIPGLTSDSASPVSIEFCLYSLLKRCLEMVPTFSVLMLYMKFDTVRGPYFVHISLSCV